MLRAPGYRAWAALAAGGCCRNEAACISAAITTNGVMSSHDFESGIIFWRHLESYSRIFGAH